ncbi:MAG: YcxB family protein, partial [Flavobacteriales bacterium]
MKVTTRIRRKEYVKLLVGRAYHKKVLWVILGVGVAMAFWIIGYHCGLSFLPKPQYFQYTTLVLIMVVQPVSLILITRKTYKTSGHLKEEVEMEFIPEHIRLRGETYFTELTWANVHKVVELPNWFMLHHNSLTAILVPKRSLRPGQEEELERLLRSIPGLDLQLL